jgi:hypothetical protein
MQLRLSISGALCASVRNIKILKGPRNQASAAVPLQDGKRHSAPARGAHPFAQSGIRASVAFARHTRMAVAPCNSSCNRSTVTKKDVIMMRLP